jgi:pilus assembly protein CpaC
LGCTLLAGGVAIALLRGQESRSQPAGGLPAGGREAAEPAVAAPALSVPTGAPGIGAPGGGSVPTGAPGLEEPAGGVPGIVTMPLTLPPAAAQAPPPMPPAAPLGPEQPPAEAAPKPQPFGPPELAPLPQLLRTYPGIGPSCRPPRQPGEPGPLGSTPYPSAKQLAEYARFVDQLIDPGNTLDLVVGRARVMILKQAPKRTQIVDEKIAAFTLIGPRELSIVGSAVGTTVLNLWFDDPDAPNKERILSYLVRVIPDPEAKERLEKIYKALADEINHAFPDSYVCLFLVGDKLVVSGQAKDIAEATEILRIVRANAPGQQGGGEQQGVPPARNVPLPNVSLSLTAADLANPGGLPGLESYLLAGGPNVVNLLRIPGEQQVMLKVCVAEVNRAAARSIGVNFSIRNDQGTTVFAQQTGNIASGGAGAFGSGSGLGGGTTGTGLANSAFGALTNNLPLNLDNGELMFAINALRNVNYAKSLAEPNLVAMNGQTATFQAGGQFPVPIIGGFTASGLQGVSFIPFGVQLNFTPYITDKDKIRLVVSANVSTRDFSAETNVGGSNVPGLNTRNFATTVELREGQTLAVAGLIQNSLGADATRVPFFGDLPYVGDLFGFNRTTSGEQELVVLITPELVHPMAPKEIPPLPGSDLFEPGDFEFYLLGRLESRRQYDYRSPVMTDIARMCAYHRCERNYIQGPSGHSDEPGPAPGCGGPCGGPCGPGPGGLDPGVPAPGGPGFAGSGPGYGGYGPGPSSPAPGWNGMGGR